MQQKILTYGLLAGVIVAVPMFVLFLALNGPPPSPWGMVIGYLTMLISLSTVFVAIKRRRDDDLGGVIGFWQGFGMGLGITFVASICYMLAWEGVLALSHMDFGNAYAAALIDAEKAKGVTGDALAKFIAEMEQFKRDYANPMFRLPMTFVEIFPVGVLVSLISAGLLCRRGFLVPRRT